MSKLMKPLFVYGNYNREGKRIRANFLKTIGDYSIWIGDGEPDNDYAKKENDKYYLYIQKDEWLIPIGLTEYNLEQRAGEKLLIKEWYGDFEGREKFFNENFYKQKISEDDKHKSVREQVKKEEQFIVEHSNDETMKLDFLQKYVIDAAIDGYIDARDHGGKFPNFVGAAFLGDLEKCVELAEIRHKRLEEENRIKQEQIKEEKARKQKEKEIENNRLMEEAENVLKNGGKIEKSEVIIMLVEKYGIDIPIRTKGWIMNDLAEVTISESGSVNYRYWKRKKGSTGSQKTFDIIYKLRDIVRIA